MQKFTVHAGIAAPLPRANVNTDVLIRIERLVHLPRGQLGPYCFEAWRYRPDGSEDPDFVLNRPEGQGAPVLVAGDNFGCGSSREHAPWALVDYGFRAVVSTSIADIFRNNALKNGLLPVVVDAATHRRLVESPGTEVVVDLEALTLSLPDGTSARFPVDGFSRHCLLQGIDELGFLLEQQPAIARYEQSHGGG